MAFVDALRALNTMKAEGVVEEYAIAGAMALVFWTEPVSTYDLDVLVFLPTGAGPLVSLDGICQWASSRGYATHKEHVIIEGVPTQFLPSPGALGDEAIETAETLEYEGVSARVVLAGMVSRSEDASTLVCARDLPRSCLPSCVRGRRSFGGSARGCLSVRRFGKSWSFNGSNTRFWLASGRWSPGSVPGTSSLRSSLSWAHGGLDG